MRILLLKLTLLTFTLAFTLQAFVAVAAPRGDVP